MARAKAKKRAAKRKSAKTKPRARAKTPARKEGGWRTVCGSLADIRANIDRLDVLITPLLCQRQYFVEQAAKFKPSVAGVVVQSRVEEIIARVRGIAEKMKVDAPTIEVAYRAIIDAFTSAEQRRWRELHDGREAP